MIGDPPFETGAAKATCKELLAAVTEVIKGEDAVVAGAALISVEATEAPMALCALTANRYVVPFVNEIVAGPRINGFANCCASNSTHAPPFIE